MNFSNKGNLAEERILQLLTEKFQLFTSVFGSSDEVLGQIEDGLDFERTLPRSWIDVLPPSRLMPRLPSLRRAMRRKLRVR